MSGMTSERLQSIEDRLPGEVFPNSVEHDVLNLIDEVKRLREGIEALHGPVQEFEPCPDGPWGCGELTCTESVHTGERYHDDQPTGRVCLTCRYEDGEPHDWPCETAAQLSPTEGENDEPV